MQFEKLEIQNFGSYFGTHEIDLTTTEQQPVVILIGGNGTGKSTVFDAINWALYGSNYERDLLKRRERKIIDYLNESALLEAEKNDQFVEMSCTLYFEHEGIHYSINQALVAKSKRKGMANLVTEESDRTSTLYEYTTKGPKEHEYDTIFLDQVLPNNVKDYFLFDGDRIYNLSNPGSSKEVRDAIYRVVDLELISNASVHLSRVADEYRKEAKNKSAGELGELEEQFDEANSRFQQLKAIQTTCKDEELIIKDRIEKLEEKLRNLEATSKLQAQYDEKLLQLSHIESEIESHKMQVRNLCGEASMSFASDAAFNLFQVLDKKRTMGEIPKKVSQILLKDLIKSGKCLCGTEFKKGDHIYNTLDARLKIELNKSSNDELLDLYYELKANSNNITQSVNELKKAEKIYFTLIERRKELQVALDQIEEELKKLPHGDVIGITSELSKARNDQRSNDRKLQQTGDQIERLQRTIHDLDKTRQELGKKHKEAHQIRIRESLARTAAEELDKIYADFAEDSRQNVEKLTREEFQKFVKSSSGYNVQLTEEYELLVLDSHGNRALQRLSMGQAQCLSLAFITSISRVSEKYPPLVIDMPFGRLDSDVHDQVSKRLPELASQIILFLLPNIEWNDVTQRNLKNRASHIYKLVFDEKKRESSIIGG